MRPYVENRFDRLQVGFAPAGAFPEHLHAHVEITYLFQGEMTMQVEGNSICLRPGDMCICFPGVTHGYLESRAPESIMLIFTPDLFPDFSMHFSNSYPREAALRRENLPPDISFCMGQILAESQNGGDERILRGYMQVVLARVLPVLSLSGRKPGMTDIVYEIMKYLSAHYMETVSLDELSRTLNVSKSYLSHTFSRRIGMNFRTYVNTLRADRACLLLRITDRNITDIAYECGFETQRTFNRAFSALYGISPSDYRRQHRRVWKAE